MATLDELLKKVKTNVLDKTSLDERLVNAVRPITRIPQQFNPQVNNSVANNFWRGTPGTTLANIQRSPQTALNKLRYEFNRPREFNPKFTEGLQNAGYVTQKFVQGTDAIPFVGKPISRAIDPVGKSKIADILYGSDRRLRPGTVESGTNVPTTERVRKAGEVANLTPAMMLLLGGAKSPKLGLEKLLKLGGSSALIGGTLNKAMGGDFATGAKLGFKGASSVDLVGKFTNPLIEKITAGAYSKVNNPLVRQLVSRGTTGGLNVLEGVPMDLALGNRPLDKTSIAIDLASGLILSSPANAEIRNQIEKAVKNADFSAFENLVKQAKEQGAIFNETRLKALRDLLQDESGFIAPGEFVGKGTQAPDYKQTYNLKNKDDVTYLKRIFGNENVNEFVKGNFNYRGKGKDYIEKIANAIIVSEDIVKPFKGFKDLSTKTIEKLKGRDFVSKQFISDLTNAPDLKQQERDIIRQTLDEYDTNKIPVADFAKRVQAKLLPLDVDLETPYTARDLERLENTARRTQRPQDWEMYEQAMEKYENAQLRGGSKYESVSLDDDLRGEVSNYKENIYKSPVKNTAGDRHFPGYTDSYFGHSRIEDMADGATRRVIEVQSDLYQKGGLESSLDVDGLKEQIDAIKSGKKADVGDLPKLEKRLAEVEKEGSKLQQYNNPTAHFRMAREEIKRASIDGKKYLQFPTGETAMKIEGLAPDASPFFKYNEAPGMQGIADIPLTRDNVNIGDTVYGPGGIDYRIVELLPDGRLKAIPNADVVMKMNQSGLDFDQLRDGFRDSLATETFNIENKMDTNDPIYRFYEKELGKYLKNNFNAKMIRDENGVFWWEVPITKEYGQAPVQAFGVMAGIEPYQDEDGNTKFRFNRERALAGIALAGGLREIKKGDLDSTLKSINRDADFKNYGDNAKEMIAMEAKKLADMVEGVTRVPGADGAQVRASLNPQWYRSFFDSNGRAPNNKELFQLAEENLRTGKVDGMYSPDEARAMSEFLDADVKNVGESTPIADILSLPARQDVPLLQSPQEVITSKNKLLDIFKKTGEVKPFVNEIKSRRKKPIITPEPVTPVVDTGAEARKAISETGKIPEIRAQRVTLDEVINQPGRTIDDRGRKIEEVLYGESTPERSEFGGQREGAGLFGNLLRKATGSVSDSVGKALESENPFVRNTARLLQGFSGNIGKSSEQVGKKSEFVGGIDYSTKLGVDTQKYVSRLVGDSSESLERIHSVLDPDLAKGELKYEDLTPQEREATDFLKYVSDYINETNYKNGFISKEKYSENTDGKYIARAYEPYDYPPEFADFMNQRNQKLDLEPFKQRGEVTDWKKENAIRDPAYLVGKRLQQTMFNDNFRKMSDWLGTTKLVSDTPKPGYVKVSDHKAYGDLSGKYVRKDALEDIRGFFFSNEVAQRTYEMLNWWDRNPLRRGRKKMLTVFNPAVRLGNQVGNYVFSWFNGINPVTFQVNRNWAKNAMSENDPLYRRAVKDGLMGSDVSRADIQRFAQELRSGVEDQNVLKQIDNVLSESYGRVDDLAKLSALKTHLDRGYSYDEAFKRVYNGFQNYNAVGFLYDIGAKVPILGNPFVRFKADVMRMMKNAVVDHPIRTAGTLMAWKLFTDVMSLNSGETPEDRDTREARLGAPRVPFTNISLAVQTPWGELNASRLIGLYALNQLGESGSTGDIADYLPFEKPSLKNVGSDPLIGPLIATGLDTDFRGKSISDPDQNKYTGSLLTDEEKNANRLKYLARAYNLPTLNDLSDVVKSTKGEPNFYGQKRTPLQSILRTAGLKVEQYGAEEAQLARDKDAMYAYNAIDAENRKISTIRNQLSRGQITEDEANKRINAIQSNIEKMSSELGSGGSNVGSATATTGKLNEARVKSLNTIFNMDSVSSLPESTNYEKAQKKAKEFDVVDKVLGSDFLSAEEQEAYISQVTDLKPEEVGYYRIAKGGVEERYGFVIDKLEAGDMDKMKLLATLRYEIDEKKVLTNSVIDKLEDDGYISDAEAKLLKKLEYNQKAGTIGYSGSGSASNKVAKEIARLNRESGEDLQKLFENFSKASRPGRSRSIDSLLNATSRVSRVNAPASNSTSIQDVLSSKRKINTRANLG